MNFFEHQDKARQKTALLASYFLFAVFAIAASISAVFYMFAAYSQSWQYPVEQWIFSKANYIILASTVGIILLASLYKLIRLRRGGLAIVDLVSATEIDHSSAASDEKQLLNIVEEMSIASGIPMPRVFVMREERAINAFVAGFRPTETVLVVTQGTIDNLDRDELQGVIGHEFSHIFNADMKINLRLVAILAGILTIGRIGELLMLGSASRRHRRHHRTHFYSHNSRNSKEQGAVIALGLALIIIGYIGLFFGRLIKAAISRQRELLADASSVQFTRNPSGIANALIKIQQNHGSHLINSHAEDMSHMCFGETLHFSFSGLLATHPPLDQRITAIGPEWAARARVRARGKQKQPVAASATSPVPEGASAFAGPAPVNTTPVPPDSSSAKPAIKASALVGQPQENHVGYARSLLESIPDSLRQALRNPEQAQDVILALIFSFSTRQLDAMLQGYPAEQANRIKQYCEQLTSLGSRLRLPIIDLSLPALKHMEQGTREQFLLQVDKAIKADQKITPFEFALSRILVHHLEKGAERNRKVRFHSYRKVLGDIQLLLSLLTHASGARNEEAENLFNGIITGFDSSLTLLPARECKLEQLDQALERLCDLTPLLKAPVIDACADTVLADKQVQVMEAELLRTICTLLDCPMPPLFPSAPTS